MRQKIKMYGWRQHFPHRYLLTLLLVLLTLVLGILAPVGEKTSFAQDNLPVHGKNTYKYPAGSPEAVVSALMEVDHASDGTGRQNQDRYYLWWNLTELGGAPDECQSISVKSYQIAGKTQLPSGDVLLTLEMDVRALWLHSVFLDSKEYNYCDWRKRSLFVEDAASGNLTHFDTSHPESFVKFVFGDGNMASAILEKKSGMYPIPKAKRLWLFEVRLIKRNNKWLISSDSVPIESKSIIQEVESVRSAVKTWREDVEICEGKRLPEKGVDLLKFKTTRCPPYNMPDKNLKSDLEYLNLLETIMED